MIYYITKSSYTQHYQFWPKMPQPSLNMDDVTFTCPDILNVHLDDVDKLFPKLAITGRYGMKKIEIIEHEDGYIVREIT